MRVISVIVCVMFIFTISGGYSETFGISDDSTPLLGERDVTVEVGGWIEYSFGTYTESNPLTVGSTLINFTETNYTTRQKELPPGVTNLTWYNGTHVLTDRAGNLYFYRFRYKAVPGGNNIICTFFFDIGGAVGQLNLRSITFPRGIGIEQIGSFTNLEYTLDTWYENGAVVQAQCTADVDFYDIELTIARDYIGEADYS